MLEVSCCLCVLLAQSPPLRNSSWTAFPKYSKNYLKAWTKNRYFFHRLQLPIPPKWADSRQDSPPGTWGFSDCHEHWEVPRSSQPLVQPDAVWDWCKAYGGVKRLCVAHFIAYRMRTRLFLPLFVSVVQNAFQFINLPTWQPALSANMQRLQLTNFVPIESWDKLQQS